MITENSNSKGSPIDSEEKYSELLKSKHWKNKCQHILLRDGNVCQDCHKRGVHNRSYFRIEEIADLNNLLPVRLDGKDWPTFCDELHWRDLLPNTPDPLILFTSECVGNNLYSCTIDSYSIYNRFGFIADKILDRPHYNREPIVHKVKLSFNEDKETLDGYIYAFHFNEIISNTNFASIEYMIKKYVSDYHICIVIESMLYYLDFGFLNFSNPKSLFSFLPLHIHHEYYIQGRKPWEYDDSALVTLCAECHQKRHRSSVPLYNNDMSILKDNVPICDKCDGSGYLPEYDYYWDGVCFKCGRKGVLL